MKRKTACAVQSALALAVLGIGCSSGDGSRTADPMSSPLVPVTAVYLHEDGTTTSHTDYMTVKEVELMRAEMIELQAARLRGEEFTISKQSPCMTSSNWFFQNTSCNTSGALLCLIGTGSTDLSTIDANTWAGKITAYITWLSGGSMGSDSSGSNCNQFAQTQSCTTWSHTSTSNWLWQTSTSCH